MTDKAGELFYKHWPTQDPLLADEAHELVRACINELLALPNDHVSLTFNLGDSLDIDWFQGDFGDGETTLSNKIVKGNKKHACHNCDLGIDYENTRISTECDQ